MRYGFLLFIISISFVFCTKVHQKQDEFIISVNVKNLPLGNKIRFLYRLPDSAALIDSIIFDGNSIIFKAPKKEGFYVIDFGQYPLFLYLNRNDSDTLFITGVYDSLQATYKVKGSEVSEKIALLENKLGENDLKYKELKADTLAIDSLFKEQRNFNMDFIWKNLGDISVIIALSQRFPNGAPIINPKSDMRIFEAADTALMHRYPANIYVQEFHTFVLNKKIKFLRDNGYQKQAIVNSKVKDFRLPSINDTLNLRNLRGKYVVINFWASWCGVCKQSLNIIKTLKKRYPSIQVILFSLDIDRKMWLDTLNAYHLSLINVCDCKGWDSPVINYFDVRRIPTNVFIDKKGKILALNVSNSDVFKVIQKYLK